MDVKQTFTFDLQLFADPVKTKKTTQLSDIAINELSLVFAQKDGKQWAPRNPDAVVLGTKAGEVGAKKSSFLEKFAEIIKKGWYVKDDVTDDIDNDGDGSEDYEQILFLITGMAYDLQNAMCLWDDDMRSAAIVAGIKAFLERLDDVRSGGDGSRKAGSRHSKKDKALLDKVAAAHKEMGEHLDALGASASDSTSGKGGEVSGDGNAAPPQEAPPGASVSPPEAQQQPPPEQQQQDPPNQPNTDGAKAGEIEMTAEQIQAIVDKAVTAAVEKTGEKFATQLAAAKVDADAQVAKAKADADEARRVADEAAAKAKTDAQAAIDKANADAETAKKAAQEAQNALGKAATEARQPAAKSATQQGDNGPSRLEQVLKAQMLVNTHSTPF